MPKLRGGCLHWRSHLNLCTQKLHQTIRSSRHLLGTIRYFIIIHTLSYSVHRPLPPLCNSPCVHFLPRPQSLLPLPPRALMSSCASYTRTSYVAMRSKPSPSSRKTRTTAPRNRCSGSFWEERRESVVRKAHPLTDLAVYVSSPSSFPPSLPPSLLHSVLPSLLPTLPPSHPPTLPPFLPPHITTTPTTRTGSQLLKAFLPMRYTRKQ